MALIFKAGPVLGSGYFLKAKVKTHRYQHPT